MGLDALNLVAGKTEEKVGMELDYPIAGLLIRRARLQETGQ